jgi:hypothetical protein
MAGPLSDDNQVAAFFYWSFITQLHVVTRQIKDSPYLGENIRAETSLSA